MEDSQILLYSLVYFGEFKSYIECRVICLALLNEKVRSVLWVNYPQSPDSSCFQGLDVKSIIHHASIMSYVPNIKCQVIYFKTYFSRIRLLSDLFQNSCGIAMDRKTLETRTSWFSPTMSSKKMPMLFIIQNIIYQLLSVSPVIWAAQNTIIRFSFT
jgi:hypothetical protein